MVFVKNILPFIATILVPLTSLKIKFKILEQNIQRYDTSSFGNLSKLAHSLLGSSTLMIRRSTCLLSLLIANVLNSYCNILVKVKKKKKKVVRFFTHISPTHLPLNSPPLLFSQNIPPLAGQPSSVLTLFSFLFHFVSNTQQSSLTLPHSPTDASLHCLHHYLMASFTKKAP